MWSSSALVNAAAVSSVAFTTQRKPRGIRALLIHTHTHTLTYTNTHTLSSNTIHPASFLYFKALNFRAMSSQGFSAHLSTSHAFNQQKGGGKCWEEERDEEQEEMQTHSQLNCVFKSRLRVSGERHAHEELFVLSIWNLFHWWKWLICRRAYSWFHKTPHIWTQKSQDGFNNYFHNHNAT